MHRRIDVIAQLIKIPTSAWYTCSEASNNYELIYCAFAAVTVANLSLTSHATLLLLPGTKLLIGDTLCLAHSLFTRRWSLTLLEEQGERLSALASSTRFGINLLEDGLSELPGSREAQ